MTGAAWHALLFTVPEQSVEPVSEFLLDAGALSVDVADADAGTEAERAIFREPNEASKERWTRNRVSALFSSDLDAQALEAVAVAAGNAQGFAPGALSVTRVNDEDWVRVTQSQFAPIEITSDLWIVPTWCSPPKPNALNLMLDPGMAFGTGSHPTTALCLRWLRAGAQAGWLRDADVLDYGCGSGILAIAAAKMGARCAFGTDIDARAVEVAAENAARNHAQNCLWALPDALPHQTYPIVVANILSNPLCVLAPILCASLASGGRIALSGVLEEQIDRVTQAYAPWVSLRVEHALDGWQLLTGERA